MFEKVCEILADKFDADASTMTMDTKVKEDLNADSLDVVELMMDLEENFGVTISGSDTSLRLSARPPKADTLRGFLVKIPRHMSSEFLRLRANAMESRHGAKKPLFTEQWLFSFVFRY